MENGKDGAPIIAFTDAAEWRQWLDHNHQQGSGVWLKFAKKASGITTVTYAEALDEALCYGWIDSLVNKYDNSYYLQKFSPRKARSVWSKINRNHVERLISEGRMRPSGQAEVDRAKADGRWAAAYDSQKNMAVPADLQKALQASKKAATFFDTLSGSNRYAILFRIHTAKRPETRAARIDKFVAMLERGEKIYS